MAAHLMETSLAVLERALRERLREEIGEDPAVNRAAHLAARAAAAGALARALEDEARRQTAERREDVAMSLRAEARRVREQAREFRDAAAAIEASALGCPDPGRFAELARAVGALEGPDGVRPLLNEIRQAEGRVGVRGVGRLAAMLEARGAELGLKLPSDVRSRLGDLRFRARVARAPGPADAGAPAGGEDPAAALLQQALRLQESHPGMDKDELFHRIVAIAARLKQLQHGGGLPREQEARVREAFSILTRLSKDRQPGWTPALDPHRTGEDWDAMARRADRWLEEREARRREGYEKTRGQQQREALRRFRERQRRSVLEEALQRIRKDLYILDSEPDSPYERERAVDELRRQAAIAVRAAAGEPGDLKSVADLLEPRKALFAEGGAFRPLRRLWGAPEPAAAAEPEAEEATPEEEEAEEILADVESEWPESIAEVEGAGRGERVLLVGGLRKQAPLRDLKEFFRWDDAEWEESYRDHQADFRSLRRRIRDGRFDRVIVLSRFCGHDVTQSLLPTCRAHGVAWHVHPRGVSIPAIAQSVYGAAG